MSSKANRGAQEAKAAMGELIAELDRTRKEYAKASLQVTQLDTTVQYLKDTELKKDQAIRSLETELGEKELQHKQEVAVIEEEFRTKDTAWAHRVKHLELELQRLQEENQAMSLFEKENRQLRDTVLENQAVIERLQLVNDDLRSRAKDDNKEHAQVMEEEFRRRLADSEKKFRAEAYRALSEEAKLALQGNDHLQTVLQRQNDSIEAVLLRCRQLEQSHSKIQQEQEAGAQSLQHHVNEIQRLKKQLADSRSKSTLMEEALKQRKVERASLELLFIEYETTRKQLNKANEKARRAAREAERWKNRAVQLTHELGDEQRDTAERKLHDIELQSDNIEQQLVRRRQRSAQRARERKKIAEGAAALRAAAGSSDEGESDISGDDGDSVGGGEGEEQRRTVNPMEILAMWNVNFDAWNVPPEAGPSAGPGDPEEPPVPAQLLAPAANSSATAASSGAGPQAEGTTQDPLPALFMPNRSANEKDTSQALNPVRPPPAPQQQQPRMRVDDRKTVMDQQLSVLSKPRNATVPASARHYQPSKVKKEAQAPLSQLSVVSHGQFKVSQKSAPQGGGGKRFLAP